MRVAIGLLAFVSCAAMAQSSTPNPAMPVSMQMLMAIGSAHQRVCALAENSRQCEILRDLFGDQLAITQGRMADLQPKETPEEKAALRAAIRQTQQSKQ